MKKTPPKGHPVFHPSKAPVKSKKAPNRQDPFRHIVQGDKLRHPDEVRSLAPIPEAVKGQSSLNPGSKVATSQDAVNGR